MAKYEIKCVGTVLNLVFAFLLFILPYLRIKKVDVLLLMHLTLSPV